MADFLHREVRIEYAIDGPDDAPMLLLSNSLGTAMAMWEPQMPELTSRFRVVRYDMRGHGRSAVPPGPYSIAVLGGDVIALMRHLECARAHFCGLSMSGIVGQWLALHEPAHLDRLVLCNTAARIGPAEAWNARIAAVAAGGMFAIAEPVLARWFTPAFIAAEPPAVAAARAMLLATSPAGYAAACAAVRDADLREDVARIGTPTLVIAGAHDVATTPADGRFLAERIALARYVELDAAHISNLEQPAGFTRAVLDFLT